MCYKRLENFSAKVLKKVLDMTTDPQNKIILRKKFDMNNISQPSNMYFQIKIKQFFTKKRTIQKKKRINKSCASVKQEPRKHERARYRAAVAEFVSRGGWTVESFASPLIARAELLHPGSN